MASVNEIGFKLLFKRPLEGLFTKRDNIVFDVPKGHLTDRYKPIGDLLQSRLGDDDVEQIIPLQRIQEPNLEFTEPIKKNGVFSLFNLRDRKIAGDLIKLFMDEIDVGKFLSLAAYVRDRVNPYLFQYALAVAMSHRADTKDIQIPSIASVFPDQFIDPKVFRTAREEQALSESTRQTIDIPLNFTASDLEDEQRLGYYREDIAINLHHWHWHLVYPAEGEDRIVKKDRRGELWYYMHSQTIQRYNVERMCNGLKSVQPLSNLRVPIKEAYFPKIIRSSNGRSYPPRVRNAVPQDIDRPDDSVIRQVSDLERWRDRILQVIDQGYCVDTTGKNIPLDEYTGIDLLADIIESSKLSKNRQLYGDFHGEGHVLLGYIHDPENRYLEQFGVMGDLATTMRDPIFYRWHSYIENLFIKFKDRLNAYNLNQLGFDGIKVNAVNVRITHGKSQPNILLTYWQHGDVDLGAGLDFGNEGNVYAQFTHLQHAPFETVITVSNDSGTQRRGTCRLFICPRDDELGTALTFNQKRLLMIEIDKFDVNLNPGENIIRRRDDESNVTQPYERSFRKIGPNASPAAGDRLEEFQFCGCGWPHHLLIPRGTPNGKQFDIFAMISNYDDDRVVQVNDIVGKCDDAASYCGLRNKKYPDRRPMGYPFDRPANSNIRTLEAFVQQTTNMGLGQCKIRFADTTIDRS